MPYLEDKDQRNKLDAVVKKYISISKTPYNWITGKLNYFLFKLAQVSCCNYQDYRDFIGELEAAKLEIYRRLIATYEDEKIKENGDVE